MNAGVEFGDFNTICHQRLDCSLFDGEPKMHVESLSTELVEKAFQFIANPQSQMLPAELQHLQPGHWQALGQLLAAIYAEKQVRLLN
ncbi:MAG: hypothetical protein EBX60_09690 [Betaproteobacteria bacterium]|nr:hypothetical protein [Betaproteobacteria bacterium]